MTLQEHDELVFECDTAFADTACGIITREMENVADFSVPLKADIGRGLSWEEAH